MTWCPAEGADTGFSLLLLLSSGLLSAQQRLQVGLLCKRLIDGGRLDFLRSRGFSGRLQRYVDHQVTLENILLSAVPSS